jgi:hypothetical protein
MITTIGGDHRDGGQGSSRRPVVIIVMVLEMIATICGDHRDGGQGS